MRRRGFVYGNRMRMNRGTAARRVAMARDTMARMGGTVHGVSPTLEVMTRDPLCPSPPHLCGARAVPSVKALEQRRG